MIELEERLRPLVDSAPDPTDIGRLRMRVNRRHRRNTMGGVAAGLVATVGIAAVALSPNGDSNEGVQAVAEEQTTAVTLLDGTQLDLTVSTDVDLGDPRFNASLQYPGSPEWGTRVEVERGQFADDGPHQEVTADGLPAWIDGDELHIQYDEWYVRMIAPGLDSDQRSYLVALVRAAATDPFLVLDPEPPLVVAPIDSPDVEFLDGRVGILLSTYPEGCPVEGVERDPVSGTWWCLHDAGVVVHVTDDALADRLVDTLRVRRIDPEDR